MLRAHEPNAPRFTPRPQYWWIITHPDGSTFRKRASVWFMAEYYGKADWPYEGEGESCK